ncbi:hypothetical protein DL769_001503 [Monosporascus sp. CRB-8-3]|nr:hypothetical protein DL769_001503 [Monosporascus sp. CRB-8-3]
MGDAFADTAVTGEDRQVLRMLQRISTSYLREFDKQVPAKDPARRQRPTSCYFNYAKYMTDLVARGENPWVANEWQRDTLAGIYKATDRYEDLIPDVKIMYLVGQQRTRVFRGETTTFKEFRESGLLDDYYTQDFGFKQVCQWLSRALTHICSHYPYLNTLEIGARTGGATKNILPALDRNFLTPLPRFRRWILKKIRLIRAMLRAHMREGSHNCTTGGLIFGFLAGRWLDVDQGRTSTRFVSGEEWDPILRATGSSGVDTVTPKEQEDVYAVAVLVARATDDEIQFVREPMSSVYAGIIHVSKTLADVDYGFADATSTVVSLADLDEAVFDDIRPVQ